MNPDYLSLQEIRESKNRQTFCQWLYCWIRHHGKVYVTDQISHNTFLWVSRGQDEEDLFEAIQTDNDEIIEKLDK